MRLREEQVEESAARTGRAFDELQIFGAKNHGAERAEIISQFADGPAIETEAAFGGGPIHFYFAIALADDFAADEITFLTVTNHLRAADAAKGTERRHEIDGFEDVRFALRIVAEEEMEAGRKIDVEPRVIAEVAESEMSQVHGAV
jgi:hypothetical protein